MSSEQTYGEQTETEKEPVKDILAKLATDRNRPQADGLSFMVADLNFDYKQLSILDPNRKKIVVRASANGSADASATPAVRRRLET